MIIHLGRLMGDGRAVVIAVDHGMFDGPIEAMEDLPATVAKVHPDVDGVLLAPGMLRHCASAFAGRGRPAAVVRLNWNTVYCFRWGGREAASAEAWAPAEALREGMDVALVSLTLNTGSEARDARNVEVFARTTGACHALGVPVIGEYFPAGHADMTPEQLHDNVRAGARIAAELGADAVKSFHTRDFAAVTAAVPVPVLGLGAERLPTQREALALAAAEVAAGAGGVVFGRNAVQVPDPRAFQAALCEVVRAGADPDEAARKHGLE